MPKTNRADRAERWKNSCFILVVVEASGKVRWPPQWKAEQKRNYLEHSREAEAMVDMTHEAVSENVATTGDIAKLTAELARLEARMMARMTVGFIGLAGLIVAAVAVRGF